MISFCPALSLQSLEYPCAWRLRSRTWVPIESSRRVTTLWTVAPYPHSQWVLRLHLPLLGTLWSPCCSRSPAPPPADSGSGSGVPSSRSLPQLPNPGLGLCVAVCPSQPYCLVLDGPLLLLPSFLSVTCTRRGSSRTGSYLHHPPPSILLVSMGPLQ